MVLQSVLQNKLHGSDSNQGSDYVATFVSLISGFQVQKCQNLILTIGRDLSFSANSVFIDLYVEYGTF